MMRMPQVPTTRPRLLGGASSEIYTGTWAEQIPTAKPLMKRPTTSMAMFWDAQTIIEPMHQITAPIWE
jgi:hypothetical protein